MKRLAVFLLIIVMMLSAGCGGINYKQITLNDLQQFADKKEKDKLLAYIDHYYGDKEKQELVQNAIKLMLDNDIKGGKEDLSKMYIDKLKPSLIDNKHEEVIIFTQSYSNAGGMDKNKANTIINLATESINLKAQCDQEQKKINNLTTQLSELKKALPSQEIITLEGYMIKFRGNDEYEFAFPEYDNYWGRLPSDKHALLQATETKFKSKGWFDINAIELESTEVILTEEAGSFETSIRVFKEVPESAVNKYHTYIEKKESLQPLQDSFSELIDRKTHADVAILKLLKPADNKNQSFMGKWTDNNGKELEIEDISADFIVGTMIGTSNTSDRIAGISFQGLLFDNRLDFPVTNDGWNNTGTGALKLTDNTITINLKLVENADANWSMGSGEFIFHKDKEQTSSKTGTSVQEEIIYAVETGDERLSPQQVDPVPGGYCYEWDRVTASSTLPASKNNTYFPSNAVDVNSNTAWVEGAPDAGIGEWISFENNVAKEISYIQIKNGYTKNEEVFWANNRLKKIRIEFSNDDPIIVILKDGYERGNNVYLNKTVKTTSLKITILDVYKGQKYDDTCISEIWVF